MGTDMKAFIESVYWKRKTVENIASEKISQAESEFNNANSPYGVYFPLTDNAKQAVRNQTIYLYLKSIDEILSEAPNGYVAKQIFSGDDR